MVPIYDAVISGYNGCVITYGQTGTGKTHTIIGQTKSIEHMGIIPRTFHYLFEMIKKPMYEHVDFSIKLYFLEIYNDRLYDLLGDEHGKEVKIKGSGTPTGEFSLTQTRSTCRESLNYTSAHCMKRSTTWKSARRSVDESRTSQSSTTAARVTSSST